MSAVYWLLVGFVLGALVFDGLHMVLDDRRRERELEADIDAALALVKPEVAETVEHVTWLRSLRDDGVPVIPIQRGPHPIHDQLATETFRRQLDEYGRDL